MPEATIPDPRTRSVILKALIIAEARIKDLEHDLAATDEALAGSRRQVQKAGRRIEKLKAKIKKLKA